MKKVEAAIYLDVPDYQIGEEVTVHFKDTMSMHAVCVARSEPLPFDIIHDHEKGDIILADRFGQELGRMALNVPTKEFNEVIEGIVQDLLKKQKATGQQK